jgi:indoleamine 2,3-dioxygenase
MQEGTLTRGFLPETDPATQFRLCPELQRLDELGRDLPSLLIDPGARDSLRRQTIPPWPATELTPELLPELRLYYLRLGFLASGYINQVGQPRETKLPSNLARPLVHACRLLNRPPILSYDGYALYNWKRFDPSGPIALGNIDTLQNFVHLYDEHWFILVHVEIEARAAAVMQELERAAAALTPGEKGAPPSNPPPPADAVVLSDALLRMAQGVWTMVATLRRIPEHMDPALYYRTFRPYIRFFENVVYEGVSAEPLTHRGETGAQSSIMPALVTFLKLQHRPTALTDHLAEMRRFMPREHREYLERLARLPSPRPVAEPDAYNELLEAIAAFREVHYGWAIEYIHKHEPDPRGTGGTPYIVWLKQLIDETRAQMLPASSRGTPK